MSIHYLDASALAKLYINEPGTDLMRSLADPAAGHQFAILALAEVEFRSAVRRRQRAGDFSAGMAERLLRSFAADLRTAAFQRRLVNDAVLGLAASVVDRHPLKANDALQLAGCLMLRMVSDTAPVFVCSDLRLLQAAQAEGLAILDPAPTR